MKENDILEFIRFNAKIERQEYDDSKKIKDIFDLQAEGVTRIINTLDHYNIALLADEVGMGKTFQALAVVTEQFRRKPDSKVLIIAPRKEVLKQWREQEYKTFYENHIISNEKYLPQDTDDSIVVLHNFEKGLFDHRDKNKIRIVFAKTTSFMAKKNFKDENRKKDLIQDINKFDLIVIDEAHKFRNYSDESYAEADENNSNIINTAKILFSSINKECKVLLLTATPLHSRNGDLKRVVELFKKNLGTTDKDIMDNIMTRRLRVMSNGETKYHYRNECDKAIQLSQFDNYKNELFFAMLQKEYVKSSAKNLSTSSSLLSYLEGTRFDELKEDDSGELKYVLQKFQEKYNNTLPTNNKYEGTIEEIISTDDKTLVFVRRVASAYEIARRYIEEFDKQAWELIDNALDISKHVHMPKNRKKFNRIMETYNHVIDYDTIEFDWERVKEIVEKFRKSIPSRIYTKTAHKMIIDLYFEEYHHFDKIRFLNFIKELKIDENHDKNYEDSIKTPKSIILDLFKKKKDDPSTHASRFLQKFFSPHSPYNKFFEEDLVTILNNPTLTKEKTPLIKSAVLHASIGVVELYCCDLKAKGEYSNFLEEVKKQSDTLVFIKQVNGFLEHYDKFEKYIKFNENNKNLKDEEDVVELNIDYTLFHNSQPAYPYVGSTKNDSVIARFNSPFFPIVLCGTSTIQEGVNLHLFCDRVVHFGAAYTMGDDEQRIGRVDRLMGKVDRSLSENHEATLDILYPFLEKTFDEDHLRKLLYNKRSTEILIDKGNEIVNEDRTIQVDNSIAELLHKPFRSMDYSKK